jgi:DNA polymerase III alpha subunit
MRFENNDFYLKPAAEMRRLFNGELPDAMDNTLLIAEQCNVEIDLHSQLRLPPFEVPAGGVRWVMQGGVGVYVVVLRLAAWGARARGPCLSSASAGPRAAYRSRWRYSRPAPHRSRPGLAYRSP